MDEKYLVVDQGNARAGSDGPVGERGGALLDYHVDGGVENRAAPRLGVALSRRERAEPIEPLPHRPSLFRGAFLLGELAFPLASRLRRLAFRFRRLAFRFGRLAPRGSRLTVSLHLPTPLIRRTNALF